MKEETVIGSVIASLVLFFIKEWRRTVSGLVANRGEDERGECNIFLLFALFQPVITCKQACFKIEKNKRKDEGGFVHPNLHNIYENNLRKGECL